MSQTQSDGDATLTSRNNSQVDEQRNVFIKVEAIE
jgi:hypothetical protein